MIKPNRMKTFIILVLFVTPTFLNAQNTMYFMDRVPQNIACNPAFIPDVKFHIALPGIGGVSANGYNSGFNYNELENFLNNLSDENYNPDEFVNSIGEYNKFFAEAKANIFTTGFKLKETGYFTFNISVSDITVSKTASDIAYLLADVDEIADDDFPIVVDDIDFLSNNYMTIGFTYARMINEHLTLGISPRLNFNEIGLNATGLGYKIELEAINGEKDYNSTILGEAEVGLPVEINPEAIDGTTLDLDAGLFPEDWINDLTVGDLLKNKSFSIDFGATYAINEWTLSASVLNMGASKWKTNGYSLNGENETIQIEEKKVNIGIPAKVYIGAIRQFSPKWNYGVVFNNNFYNSGSDASATFSLNGYVGSMLSTSVSYTAGYRYNNFGLGLRLRFLPGTDLYFVTDNLIQAFDYKNAYRASAAIGINLSFGVKDEKQKTISSDEETTLSMLEKGI